MTGKLPMALFPPNFKRHSVHPDTAMPNIDKPAHYTAGAFEAIDVIEDVVQHAPNLILGSLQWQVLKYILRMWHKDNALEDAKKARWYLNRLIDKLEK